MSLLIILLAVRPSKTDSDIQRMNYGIVFENQQNLRLSQDYWYHTYEIQLPKFQNISKLPVCRNNNRTCILISHVTSQLNTIRSETEVHLNNTINTIMTLIPETKIHKSRSRRSLLPFIGKLSKGLFGTATMDDVNILANHMNKLTAFNEKLSKTLTQQANHLSSYMSSANHRMDNLMAGIKDNMLAIKFVQAQVFASESVLEQSIDYIMSILINQTHSASKLNHEIDMLNLGITDLVNNKLSPLLIPEETLLSSMTDIQNILQTKYNGFHLVYTDILDVYKYVKFLYARNGTNLYVTIKIPISHFEKSFKQYKIRSLPVPVNATSPHATQLLDLPDYFVISHDQQYYATLNFADLENCVGDEPTYCMTNFPLIPVTTKSCLLALFANDKEQVISKCDFRFVHDIIQPNVIKISSHSVEPGWLSGERVRLKTWWL